MNSLLLAIPGGASIALIALVLGIFIIPMWFLYEKANYPGWTSLIPILAFGSSKYDINKLN